MRASFNKLVHCMGNKTKKQYVFSALQKDRKNRYDKQIKIKRSIEKNTKSFDEKHLTQFPFIQGNAQELANMQTEKKSIFFNPRNQKQAEYLEILVNRKPSIVVTVGPAGTSKTMGATLIGLELLMKKQFDRLVLTRPAVSADEELGFLKGDLKEKMKPWLLPIYDTLLMYMDHDQIESLMESKNIEICSLSHMRGRTFRNCFVVIDESQNTTISQMLMLLTRIGENSKFVFTGDLKQHDRCIQGTNNKNSTQTSGLANFVELYTKKHEYMAEVGDFDSIVRNQRENVALFEFDHTHIERHSVIPYILDLYAE